MAIKIFVKDKALFARLRGLPREALLRTPIETVPFCVRALNAFSRMSIKTIEDLATRTRFELLKSRNLGRVSVKQIEVYLEALGLALGMHPSAESEAEQLLKVEQQKNEKLVALLQKSQGLIAELQEALR